MGVIVYITVILLLYTYVHILYTNILGIDIYYYLFPFKLQKKVYRLCLTAETLKIRKQSYTQQIIVRDGKNI